MNRTISWIAAGMLLLPLAAQKKPAPVEDARTRLKNLQVEQKQVIADWQAKAREAAEKAAVGGRSPVVALQPDFTQLRGKYLAAGKQYPGETAVSFLLPALGISSTPQQRREVLELLLNEHIDSSQLNQIGQALPTLDRLVGVDYAREVFARIEKHGKNPGLLGWLAFARHESTLRSEPATSKAFLDAKAAAAGAITRSEDTLLQRQFDALVAVQEKFGIGVVAPDISGVDLDGAALELGDHRGKVVLLDFWGDWSGACRDMYPHERSLVDELKDKQFALVGVNSDPTPEVARQAAAANNLTWRSFQNKPAGQEHAISDSWFIQGWPTFFVLDPDMKIRYRGPDGAEAVKVVKERLALVQ
ncbi:MAG TPA: TlpA disulfide reductase family protein [Planctomycetota bacterium]|nr:TlpA disulfide reductase family protein [Planctomycetota bacterium]